MARYMPSGAKLPSNWTKDMDRFICQCEALGDVDTRTMVRGLKKKFPELEGSVIIPESIERRIQMLELGDNDYFVLGMETAVARPEAAGFPLPPMDLEKYATKVSRHWRFAVDEKSDLLNVLGSLLRWLVGPEAIPVRWRRPATRTSRPKEKTPPR